MRSRLPTRSTSLVLVTALALAAGEAQVPLLPAAPSIATYRAPAIVLAHPPAGGNVPSDRPVVVFRFAAGEQGDPIDVRSFVVTVDGVDRTSFFRVTASEAWGPLRKASGRRPSPGRPGSHDIAARICSTRGVCGTVTGSVAVTRSPAVAAASWRGRIIDLLLRVARRLLTPS